MGPTVRESPYRNPAPGYLDVSPWLEPWAVCGEAGLALSEAQCVLLGSLEFFWLKEKCGLECPKGGRYSLTGYSGRG